MPVPKTKEVVRLTIEKSVFGGDGLADLNGKRCFVEGALPGETVEARVLEDKKDWARARTVKVVRASSSRVEPPCRYYKLCGGCQYQHVSYPEELRLKEEQVREVFAKIAGLREGISAILHGEKDYGYRRSATFHVATDKKKKTASLSFIGRDNVTPIRIQSCHLLDPSLEKVLNTPLKLKLEGDKVTFKLTGDGSLASDEKEAFFRVKLSGRSLLVSSRGFFQNNWEVTELLAGKISGWMRTLEPRVFFDLYSGVGTFTFLCAEGVPRIVCLEENPHAVSALRMNCQEYGWAGLEAVEGRVERLFEKRWGKEKDEEAVIFMDPPRQGLEKELAGFLAREVKAKALIYVSCDPATLARDMKTLLGSGRWRLQELIPYDMFPRTKHVEAAALLYYNEGTSWNS